MKTLTITIALVMALMTTTAFSATFSKDQSTNQIAKNKQVIYLELSKAIQNPGLVQQMYIRLDDDFLNGPFCTAVYTKTVFYNRYQYQITGTYIEWTLFFLMDL